MPKQTQKPPKSVPKGELWIGDNLPIMIGMESETVDLIYADPPFKSETFRRGKTKELSFDDTWSDVKVDFAYAYPLKHHLPKLWELIVLAEKMHSYAMHTYLVFMATRLIEMRRLLKPTGSLYLHCDHSAGHYLKLLLDCIFGKNNFRNEIVWDYRVTGAGNPKSAYQKRHDIIFYYSKSKSPKFSVLTDGAPTKRMLALIKSGYNKVNQANGRRYLNVYDRKRVDSLVKEGKLNLTEFDVIKYFDASKGKRFADVFNIDRLIGTDKERTGQATQKPLALLERIIRASSNADDLVLDPFCGCATACVAAAGLHRRWIGIDQKESTPEVLLSRLTGDLSTHEFDTNMPVDAKLKKPKPLPKQKLHYPGKITNRQAWEQLIQRDVACRVAPFCRGCRTKPENYKLLQPDHVLAQSKGGLSVIENFVLLCADCNHKKGNRSMEFLYRRLDEETQEWRDKVARTEIRGR